MASPSPENIMADFGKRSGLPQPIVQQFYNIFPNSEGPYSLSELIPPENGDPPLNTWGSDDWVKFFDEYLKTIKTSSSTIGKFDALKQTIASSLKTSASGDGKLGQAAASKRIQMKIDAQKAAAAKERANSVVGIDAPPPPPGLTPTDAAFFMKNNEISIQDYAEKDWKINTSSWGANEWQKLYISITNKIPGSTTLQAAEDAEASEKMVDDAHTWFNSIPGVAELRAQRKTEMLQRIAERRDSGRAAKRNVAMQGSVGMGTMSSMGLAQGTMSSMGQGQVMMPVGQGGIMFDLEGMEGADLSPIVASLDKINTTFNKALTTIENRMKKDDFKLSLDKTNAILDQIYGSMPEPASGGGRTRRLRRKGGRKITRRGKMA